ncbi:hypothetical protein D1872_311530 [compost metagenome]
MGRCQCISLFSSRMLAEPSTRKEPSGWGWISSLGAGAMEVVKSPTISSRMSSRVISP